MDPILFWNEVALEANRADHTGNTVGENQRGPTLSSRALAIVHLAIHDAYFGVRGVAAIPGPAVPAKRTYLIALPAGAPPDSDVNRNTAVAGAAATALVQLYASQSGFIEQKVAEWAGANGNNDAAFSFGRRVAYAVLATRSADALLVPRDEDYTASPGPLRHRKDPLNPGQPYFGVAYGQAKTFAVGTWQVLAPPPPRSSPSYAANLAEVLTKGGETSLNTTTRTADETAIGYYWAYDGAMKIGTPPRLYNQIARVLAISKKNTVDQNARMFALINAALADAGVHAWHYKYCYDLWRPILGIREDDPACGPTAVPQPAVNPPCNPFWRPLGSPRSNEAKPSFTPPFPSYPSGHAVFGAAAFEVMRQFYRFRDSLSFTDTQADALGFSFVSDELDGRTTDPDGSVRVRHNRSYTSLSNAMYENSVSRIFLGVHWRFDGTTGTCVDSMLSATDSIGGVPLGRAIARNVFTTGMQQQAVPPVAGPKGCI